jgi:hypothetical protein
VALRVAVWFLGFWVFGWFGGKKGKERKEIKGKRKEEKRGWVKF